MTYKFFQHGRIIYKNRCPADRRRFSKKNDIRSVPVFCFKHAALFGARGNMSDYFFIKTFIVFMLGIYR